MNLTFDVSGVYSCKHFFTPLIYRKYIYQNHKYIYIFLSRIDKNSTDYTVYTDYKTPKT